jgi:predicted lipoprotein with Yx(FWY)xxD motif
MIGSRHHGFLVAAAALPLAGMVLTGCGSGNDASAAAAKPMAAGGQSATFGVADNDILGKILVDAQGRTLYLFEKDTGTKSTCTGACAAEWPPLRVDGSTVLGTGLSAGKVGSTARSDGKAQVTYNGRPIYRYAADRKAGDINGQGINAFGGGWFALSPTGDKVAGGGMSGGGGGY